MKSKGPLNTIRAYF